MYHCRLRTGGLVFRAMHYNWSQHQHLANSIATVPNDNLGTALALMGIAFLILCRDLDQELSGAQRQPATNDVNP